MQDAPVIIERDQTSITMGWHRPPISFAQDDAFVYELQIKIFTESESQEENWTMLSNKIKSNTIRKKNLSNNVPYIFRIRYCLAQTNEWSDFSNPSEPAFVINQEFQMLNPPIFVSNDTQSLTIQWDIPDPKKYIIMGYRIRYRRESDLHWTFIESMITSNKCRKKGLEAAQKYFFSVIPLDNNEDNLWSYSSSSLPLTISTTPSLSPFITSLLPTSILHKQSNDKVGSIATNEALGGKIIAVYFSAHWCGPCRQFTPRLIDSYVIAKKQSLPFEVLFCSADNNIDEFMSYYSSMPWLAIDYHDEIREKLMGTFKVSGIPRLCVLGVSGRIIVDNAVASDLSIATIEQWINISNSQN
eukprot:gene6361-8761_t